MTSERFRFVRRCVVALGVVALLATAQAQYTTRPFLDHPIVTSHGFGLDIMASRLLTIEALDPVPAGYLEQVEKLLEDDMARFAGTLAARDPELATAFEDALAALIDDVAAGEAVASRLPGVWDLHERVYDVLIGDEHRDEPAFIAAVMADVLLGSDGVAEAYEEAVEDDEPWNYSTGWGALEHIKSEWTRLEPLAEEQQIADFVEMIEFLEVEVYPRPTPPEGGVGGDPEVGEGATQRMVGILEVVSGAELYAGRDLGRLAEVFVDVLEPACEAYAAGNDAVGVEGILAVRNPYRKHHRRTLDLIAPDIHEPAAAHLDALVSSDPPEDRAGACRELQDLLSEARSLF